MFKEDYRRDMNALILGARGKERIVEAMESKRPVRRGTGRTVLIAAALCVVMAVTALAVSPGLREALMSALGSFAPYSQEFGELVAVDQGIEVKVVSALSDGNVIRLYFTARDLEGDRLDEFTSTNFNIDWPTDEQQNWAGWQGAREDPPKLVSYDSETKTALFVVGLTGDGQPMPGLTVTAGAQHFTPGMREFRLALPELDAPSTVQSKTLEGGETVLIPGQTQTELESDVISLSSYGFADDGRLHLLYKSNVPEEKMYAITYIVSRAWKAGDETAMARTERYISNRKSVVFQEGGATYCDESYDAGLENAADILPAEITGAAISGKEIEGTWRFEVPLENAEARVIDLWGSGTVLDGVTGERLSLTCLGATVEGDPNGTSSQLAYKLTAFLKDDSRLHGTVDSNYYSGEHCSAHSSFQEPLDIDQVVGVALGMWYIPIDGDVAGQGHWLDAMP